MRKKYELFFTVLFIMVSLVCSPLIAAEALSEKDYVIAGLKIMDSLKQVQSSMGELKLVKTEKDEISHLTIRTYEGKGVKMTLANYGQDKQPDWRLWFVEISSSGYPTFRGVKVGDRKEKVREKYGAPEHPGEYKKDGRKYLLWDYADMDPKVMKSIAFRIDKEKGVVTSISIGQIID